MSVRKVAQNILGKDPELEERIMESIRSSNLIEQIVRENMEDAVRDKIQEEVEQLLDDDKFIKSHIKPLVRDRFETLLLNPTEEFKEALDSQISDGFGFGGDFEDIMKPLMEAAAKDIISDPKKGKKLTEVLSKILIETLEDRL